MAFNLPEDLEQNILLRLPVKSLVRLRCVNKTWNSLLTLSNYFITTHLHQNLNNRQHGFFLLNSRDNLTNCLRLLSHDSFNVCSKHAIPSEYGQGLRVVGCCNGLICLYDVFGTSRIMVYNPSIRKHEIIPYESALCNYECTRRGVAYGFGYDSVNKDYKVVRLFRPPYPYTKRVAEVYTLGVDSWRKIEATIPDDITCLAYYANVVYLNGASHWLGETSSKSYVVLSFDFTREVFQLFPLPNKVTKGSKWNLLNRLNIYLNRDQLCVGKRILIGEWDLYYDIWAMSEYGVEDSWNFLHRFKILDKWFYNSVLGFGMKGELFVKLKDKLTVHYPDDEENVKKVLEIDGDGYERFFGVVTYTESNLPFKEDLDDHDALS